MVSIMYFATTAAKADAVDELPVDTLHSVEVTAKRHAETEQAVPMQTLTREAMQQQGINDVAEALRRMAGTTVRDYGSAGGMKTLSVRGMGATHTGVILDGIAVTDGESGQIDLSRFFLDEIEELSLTVGNDAQMLTPARNLALAANVTFNTVINSKKLQGEAAVTTGSWGLVEPRVRIGVPLSHTWTMQAKGHFLRADNNYPFTLKNGVDTKTEYRHHNAIASGTGMLDFHHEREDGRHEANIKAYYYGADKELPGQVVVYNPYNDEEQHQHNAFVQGNYKTFFHHGLSIEAHAKGNWDRLVYRDFGTQYVDGIRENRYDQWEGYGGATLLWVPLKQWSFSVGADYTFQQLFSNTLTTCQDPYRHTFQGQVSAKWHTENWTARATLLFSDYENEAKSGTPARDARRFSPNVSLAWHQLSWLTLRASYQDKFRMPTFADNYYTKMGSRDLLPEKAQGVNFGVGFQGKIWSVNVDGFYQWLTDKIVAIPMNMMFWNMMNVGKVESRGVEAKASVGIPFKVATKMWEVDVDANYTLQEAVNTTDPTSRYYRQQIAYTPVHSGGASVALQMPWVSLGVNATAMSERYATNEHQAVTHLDGCYELGVTLWHRFELSHHGKPRYHLTLRGDIKNLTNEQYEIVKGYPMPGINWRIAVNFEF